MACSIDLTITNVIFLGVLAFAIKKFYNLTQIWRIEKMLAKWKKTPKDKVILHTIWRCKTLPSISPFALKLETFLRMAKIPYELETKDIMGPKGKLPWITYNGTHVADSHLATQFIKKKLSVDMNKKATEEQVATATACRIMLENHFIWGLVHYRIVENSDSLTQLCKFPVIMKYMMPLNIRQVKKRIESGGMGKHTPTEIYQMAEDDLRTVSKILGNKNFFGGEEPCEEDCGVFGIVAQAVWALPGSSFEKLVHGELSNLKEYCERMKHLYWPDWEDCLDKL